MPGVDVSSLAAGAETAAVTSFMKKPGDKRSHWKMTDTEEDIDEEEMQKLLKLDLL